MKTYKINCFNSQALEKWEQECESVESHNETVSRNRYQQAYVPCWYATRKGEVVAHRVAEDLQMMRIKGFVDPESLPMSLGEIKEITLLQSSGWGSRNPKAEVIYEVEFAGNHLKSVVVEVKEDDFLELPERPSFQDFNGRNAKAILKQELGIEVPSGRLSEKQDHFEYERAIPGIARIETKSYGDDWMVSYFIEIAIYKIYEDRIEETSELRWTKDVYRDPDGADVTHLYRSASSDSGGGGSFMDEGFMSLHGGND